MSCYIPLQPPIGNPENNEEKNQCIMYCQFFKLFKKTKYKNFAFFYDVHMPLKIRALSEKVYGQGGNTRIQGL